jgi:hypothetical protein
MMIATVLFIVFFFFVFFFVKPYGSNVLSDSLIDGLKYGLDDSAGDEVVKLFISVDSDFTTEDGGFYFEIPGHLESVLEGMNCTAFNLARKPFDCSYSGKVFIESEEITSYNVVFSKNINSPVGLYFETTGVSFGGDFNQDVYSFKKLQELEIKYDEKYDILKDNLGFPESFDFSLTSGIINFTKEPPRDVEVLGKEFVESVLYSNGTIINERFLIKVW